MTDQIINQNYAVATGGSSTSPFVIHFDTRSPTEFDVNYPVQKMWLNVSSGDLFILSGFTAFASFIAANWINISTGAASLETLVGNVGATGPNVANQINVVGDGTYLTTVANPLTYTLTIEPGGALTQSYHADVGAATAIGGVINVVGGVGATTSAGGNTITINASATGITWSDQAVSFNALKANGYFTTANLTATLPAAPAEGDTVAFNVQGGTLTIAPNVGHSIRLGALASGISISSNFVGDSAVVVFRTANNSWNVVSSMGSWNVN